MCRFYFYFILLFSLGLNLRSQSVYFNKRFDNFNSCDGAIGIDTFANKYLTIGVACTAITYGALNLRLYDYSNGNAYLNKTYQWSGTTIIPSEGKGIRINRNIYSICGTKYINRIQRLLFYGDLIPI